MSSEDLFKVPITDVLDLHTFRPGEIADVVRTYLDAACEKRILQLRIIHGKGTGTLRETVHALLKRNSQVERFSLADPTEGGWGATIAWLQDEKDSI